MLKFLTLFVLSISAMNMNDASADESAIHKSFREAGVVSLWLGNFNSEEDLLDYLDAHFAKDFGFEIYEPSGPEQDVAESGPKTIRDLLDGFSSFQTFRDSAVALAKEKGWEQATTAVVFYNFKYDPKKVPSINDGAPLKFIGTLPYGAGNSRENN